MPGVMGLPLWFVTVERVPYMSFIPCNLFHLILIEYCNNFLDIADYQLKLNMNHDYGSFYAFAVTLYFLYLFSSYLYVHFCRPVPLLLEANQMMKFWQKLLKTFYKNFHLILIMKQPYVNILRHTLRWDVPAWLPLKRVKKYFNVVH